MKASKVISLHRWAYALKKYIWYKKFPRHINGLMLSKDEAYWPCYSVQRHSPNAQKQLDPSLRHPYYMWLHSQGEILDLSHRNNTSEHSEVALHSSQDSVSLSGWGSPCSCWSSCHVGPASGRGHRRVLAKSVGHTGPTSVHNRYTSQYSIHT
jgi:hypothetical protein